MNFFRASEIESSEYKNGQLLDEAFETARNGHTVSRVDRKLLKQRVCRELIAVNNYSRIMWGCAICNELSGFFCHDDGDVEHVQDVYLFTLVHRGWATSVSGQDIDLYKMKHRLWSALQGLSFLGMIEPALYANLEDGLFRDKRCIFWHLHALVWGVSEGRLKKLAKSLNASGTYQAIAPGFDPADARTITQGTLPIVAGYMLKSPTNAYRVYGFNKDSNDASIAPNYKQWKDPLRPGERITLFHALKHHYLDQLALSGGEGRQLLARAKRTARRQTRLHF